MRIFEAKRIESRNLHEATKRLPQFFETTTLIDDQKFLERYGISIPNKKKLPQGYLKLWPQDFIVEEISFDGQWQTIYRDKFLSKEKDFFYEDPVIYATLVKCGLSSIEAIEELALDLKVEPADIKYAGIKDKHAITSQIISIKGAKAEKLHDTTHDYFFVKNVFSGQREIHLGQLLGNQFTILIRTGNDFKKDEFLKQLKELEKNGFFNFFYLQRFGAPRLLNHYCGLCLLKGEYEEALFTAFCKPGERELLYFRQMRKEMERLWGNWEEIENVLEFFPLTFQDERQIIQHLINNPDDFIGAINQIPRVLQLWLTSFASLLFNKLLSSYIQQGKKIPRTLPLVLSSDRQSWQTYEDLLKQAGIFSTTFARKNLKPFPNIILRRRDQRTIEEVKVLNYKIIPEGVILNFALNKNCYVSTLLSHLFNLISGPLPKKFSTFPIDTKSILNQPSLEEILNLFSEAISPFSLRFSRRIY